MPKLSYFDLGGRAEAIRTMLAHANFQYEDHRIQFSELGALKNTPGALPLGSMPIWDEDGLIMCQSSAILRMLGIRLGYYTEDPMVAYQIDSIVDFAEDLLGKCNGWIFPAVTGGQIDMTKEDAWFENYWKKLLPVMEARLAEHGKKYIAGTDRPTIADFKCFAQASRATALNPNTLVPPSTLQKLDQVIASFPSYKRWYDNMARENQAYLQTRIERPI